MKPYNERLWDAYCAKIALGDSSSWDMLLDAAKYAVDYFDAHCPREEAPTTALDRAVKEREDALWASPAPNWRALVEELRDACAEKHVEFANVSFWESNAHIRASRAVSALIAALDSKDDEPKYVDWSEGSHARTQEALAQANAALEATRKELAALKAEIEESEDATERWRIEQCEVLGMRADETLLAAARRVVAERDEARKNLAYQKEERDYMAEAFNSLATQHRQPLDAGTNESTTDAIKRVIAERDELRAKLAEANAKLAAQDELRDAAVEYAEAGNLEESIRARRRYLAAKDAAAKNGGV